MQIHAPYRNRYLLVGNARHAGYLFRLSSIPSELSRFFLILIYCSDLGIDGKVQDRFDRLTDQVIY
jgi:hypothetical protein